MRWAGQFAVDRPGRWQYTVEAWTDVFGTWRDELRRKVAAAQPDLSGELSEGVVLLQAAAGETRSSDARALIEHAAAELEDPKVPASAKYDVALGEELLAAVEADAAPAGPRPPGRGPGDRGRPAARPVRRLV